MSRNSEKNKDDEAEGGGEKKGVACVICGEDTSEEHDGDIKGAAEDGEAGKGCCTRTGMNVLINPL